MLLRQGRNGFGDTNGECSHERIDIKLKQTGLFF